MSASKGRKNESWIILSMASMVIILFLTLTSRTSWVVAFEAADNSYIGLISQVLDEEGIQNITNSARGTISVLQQHLERAWTVVAQSPITNYTRHTFYDVINNSDMSVVSRMLNNALEQRISELLITLEGVEGAEVALNTHNTPNSASARVYVWGSNLSEEISENIALIVSRSVNGLSAEGVTVVHYGAQN
ncbi:MAG: hypothetical protein FWB98_02795 [Defluviitaleaceae bacterium]|nr:hypothetical protein [Defluviitaleaceae bacterium]